MSSTAIDFSQYEAKPSIDFSKYEAPPQPSAASRFGSSLLSGLGISSDEQAKQFFTHPIKTFMDSIEAQGKLAQQAKDAYDKGDYAGAVQHGLNYLLPFIGQQTDQAGNQLKTGDIAGGIGRTLGAAVPIAAGSPEVRAGVASAAGSAADTSAAAVRAGARGANTVLQKAPGSIGGVVGAAAGRATGIPGAAEVGAGVGYAMGKDLLPQVRIPGEGFGLPNRVTGGPTTAPPLEAAIAPESAEPTPPTPVDISRKAVGNAVDQSLNVQPLKPNVPLKDQLNFTPAKTVPMTEVKGSSMMQSYGYDAEAQELHITPKNTNKTYVYGDVSPDQVQAIVDAKSKGGAFKDFQQSSSPRVATIVNGKRIPFRPTITSEAAQAPSTDLSPAWQQALDRVKAAKAKTSSAAAD